MNVSPCPQWARNTPWVPLPVEGGSHVINGTHVEENAPQKPWCLETVRWKAEIAPLQDIMAFAGIKKPVETLEVVYHCVFQARVFRIHPWFPGIRVYFGSLIPRDPFIFANDSFICFRITKIPRDPFIFANDSFIRFRITKIPSRWNDPFICFKFFFFRVDGILSSKFWPTFFFSNFTDSEISKKLS